MKKIFSFCAALVAAMAMNAQSIPSTDFEGGYSCAADDATLTGDAPSDKFYLDETATPHYIAWSDMSMEYTAVASWQIRATRACYITISLDLGPVIGSNKHIFEVKVLDSENHEVGAVAEGAAYGTDFTDHDDVKVLNGKLLIPAAGNYTIELRNNRNFCKGTIKNVILTYAGEAPITDFATPGYICKADDAILSGTAAAEKFYLNTEVADNHYIVWYDMSKTYTAVASWKVMATRGCYVTVTLDLGPAISSNKHIYEVMLLDNDGNKLDSIAEAPAYTTESTDADQQKTLEGTILVPGAGNYTIELRNNRDFCKGSIKNVIITYSADAPTTGIRNTAVSAKAVKFFENGQLYILKNGVKYDITGAIVK
ncbi:MAG: hypothetical protein K6A36_00095 [Paludibacteraceae bacterium]|nr:hypothetical protein [Paludibacteraceae bacterium]